MKLGDAQRPFCFVYAKTMVVATSTTSAETAGTPDLQPYSIHVSYVPSTDCDYRHPRRIHRVSATKFISMLFATRITAFGIASVNSSSCQLLAGPVKLIAPTSSPESRKIGAQTQRFPWFDSWSLLAYPRSRTVSRSSKSSSTSVIVEGVYARTRGYRELISPVLR